MFEPAANFRGTRFVRTAPHHFLFVLLERAAAFLACGGHHPGTRIRGPKAENRPNHLGNTSPPFSMTTVSPSRMSRRATSCSLWSVAIEIVDPASRTGSRTAKGVTAPVRPTLTSMRTSLVCACWAGNLKAVAHRGNLAVAPEPLTYCQVVNFDDDAVGIEFESLPLVGPFLAEGDDGLDAFAALPVRFDRKTPVAHRGQHRGVCLRNAPVRNPAERPEGRSLPFLCEPREEHSLPIPRSLPIRYRGRPSGRPESPALMSGN